MYISFQGEPQPKVGISGRGIFLSYTTKWRSKSGEYCIYWPCIFRENISMKKKNQENSKTKLKTKKG
jgi:hypothetical protein